MEKQIQRVSNRTTAKDILWTVYSLLLDQATPWRRGVIVPCSGLLPLSNLSWETEHSVHLKLVTVVLQASTSFVYIWKDMVITAAVLLMTNALFVRSNTQIVGSNPKQVWIHLHVLYCQCIHV